MQNLESKRSERDKDTTESGGEVNLLDLLRAQLFFAAKALRAIHQSPLGFVTHIPPSSVASKGSLQNSLLMRVLIKTSN